MLGHNFAQFVGNGVLMPVVYVVLYFLPYFVATNRAKPDVRKIGWTNLFVGWTVVGWLACLGWAMVNAVPSRGLARAIKPPVRQFLRVKGIVYWFPAVMLSALLLLDWCNRTMTLPDQSAWMLRPIALIAASAVLFANLPALIPLMMVVDSPLMSGKMLLRQNVPLVVITVLASWYIVLALSNRWSRTDEDQPALLVRQLTREQTEQHI